LAYANGRWTVVGGDTALTSTDGVTWSRLTGLGSPPGSAGNVIYDNNTWMSAGGGGTFATSTDGVNWSRSTTTLISLVNSVKYGGGMWVATGYDSGTKTVVVTSTNGTSWTLAYSGTGVQGYDVRYENDTWIISADGEIISYI
jgi:hypothetical protein